jgi:hypothetical protein
MMEACDEESCRFYSKGLDPNSPEQAPASTWRDLDYNYLFAQLRDDFLRLPLSSSCVYLTMW